MNKKHFFNSSKDLKVKLVVNHDLKINKGIFNKNSIPEILDIAPHIIESFLNKNQFN